MSERASAAERAPELLDVEPTTVMSWLWDIPKVLLTAKAPLRVTAMKAGLSTEPLG